jgi:hypothetical protein
MNKINKWFRLTLAGTVLLALIIWDTKHYTAIDKEGIEVHALITGVTTYKAPSVEVEYYFNGRRYINHFGISGFEPHSGDSLTIKILPEDPEGEVFFERRFYSIPIVYKPHFDWLHKVNKNL